MLINPDDVIIRRKKGRLEKKKKGNMKKERKAAWKGNTTSTSTDRKAIRRSGRYVHFIIVTHPVCIIKFFYFECSVIELGKEGRL